MYKNRTYFENSGPNWSQLSSFVDKRHILHVIDLIWRKWLCDGDFSFLLMPLVSSVENLSELSESLLVCG